MAARSARKVTLAATFLTFRALAAVQPVIQREVVVRIVSTIDQAAELTHRRVRMLPPAYPHDPIVELFPEVFLLHGSIRMGRGMRMNRNMLILRQDGELSLINPVRMS